MRDDLTITVLNVDLGDDFCTDLLPEETGKGGICHYAIDTRCSVKWIPSIAEAMPEILSLPMSVLKPLIDYGVFVGRHKRIRGFNFVMQFYGHEM